MTAPLVQACLNGDRARREHPAIPVTPEELAVDAKRAVAAGAGALHVHVRGADERDTLDAALTTAAVEAIRESCPDIPLGLTTGLWAAGGDPGRRLDQVAAWEALPDYVSVNVSEEGFAELCGLLAERGVGVEAGVWSVADAAALGGEPSGLVRALVEVGTAIPSRRWPERRRSRARSAPPACGRPSSTTARDWPPGR